MSRLYHIARICIVVALTVLLSCSSNDPNMSTEKAMLLNSIVTTRSTSATSSATEYEKPEGTPCFIFRTRDTYVNQAVLSPYCVSLPPEKVDAYREYKYITGYNYPNDDDVFATGFSPSSLISETKEGTDAFRELTVPEELMGKYDILIASQMETGSAILPFSEPLEFMHAQVKLWLYARLDETMQKFIKNIRVTIGADQMLHKLQWDNSDPDPLKHAYKATEVTLLDTEVQMTTGPGESAVQQLSKEEKRYIGFLYLIPGRDEVTLTITADMANEADGFDNERFNPITIVTTVPFTDEDNERITLESNDSYEIEMKFNTDNVELVGRKKAWEDGGYIAIPINPFE